MDFEAERHAMVREQLMTRSISDPATLAAMSEVQRHLFVPAEIRNWAYSDGPLPIGEGQTISQPYIVALMVQAAELDSSSVVLEIGAGSGYAAAVISRIAKQVYTIERLPVLAKKAKAVLEDIGYSNVHVKLDDGTLGWPEKSPFDVIIVSAGAPTIPTAYISQLKQLGRMVIPVGDNPYTQKLTRLRKIKDNKYSEEILENVHFVPLIGKDGWEEKMT